MKRFCFILKKKEFNFQFNLNSIVAYFLRFFHFFLQVLTDLAQEVNVFLERKKNNNNLQNRAMYFKERRNKGP